MIKLFNTTDTSFISNGDKVILPLKARVHNVDNGDFYLDLTVGLEYADYIVPNRIVVANTPQGEQAFRIGNPTKTGSKIEVKCWHLYYDTKNYLVEDSFAENKSCEEAMNHFNDATEPTSPFTMSSDITTHNSYRCVRESLETAMNVILDRWGGHLVRDNYDIQIRSSIEVDNGAVVRYRKNLKEITSIENWEDVCTKILPVGKDGVLLNQLDSSASLYIASATQYDIPFTKSVSFEQNIEQEDYQTETAYYTALVNDLRSQATAYLAEHCVPQVNYTLKANLDKVTNIGEVINVIDERLGINLLTSVISYEYDCLLEKFVEIEFGNFKKNLAGLIPSIVSSASANVDKQISTATTSLQEEINSANSAIEEIGTQVSGLVNAIYPVGSIYMSVNATSPVELFGGAWEQIKDRFLLSAGDTYSAGVTGGSANAVLVSHSHGKGTLAMDEKGAHSHKLRLNDVGASGTARNIPISTASLSNSTFTDSVGGHKHTISGSTETKGVDGTGKNMPPYLAVYVWKRTA